MRRTLCGLVVVASLAIGVCIAAGFAPAQRRGLLGSLQPGQALSVKDVGGKYEISFFENGPRILGHKLIELGDDYLVVQDLAGITETHIPIYSIKSVVVIKAPK